MHFLRKSFVLPRWSLNRRWFHNNKPSQQRWFGSANFFGSPNDPSGFTLFGTSPCDSDQEAPVESQEEAMLHAKEEGKVVHPPGSPRHILRSELYGMKLHRERGPLDHIKVDGPQASHGDQWHKTMYDTQPQKFCSVDGQTYMVGVNDRPVEDVTWDAPRNERWTKGTTSTFSKQRGRMPIFTNFDMIMKIDYFMFWIPAFLIFSVTLPTYIVCYMIDEIAYSSMTVKVIGRQWYWVYEVESPVDEDDDE